MKPIEAVIYARVSTDAQDYTRQINDIQSFCKAFKYRIIRAPFKEIESGRHKKRQALTEMLDYVEKANIDYVIISELSRLGRTSEVLNTIEKLNGCKVGLISLKENLRTLNDDKSVNHTSELIVSILSGINSYELTTMKYRSRSGLLNSARQGNWGGSNHLPYGYMREKGGKKLVVNPDEAPVIKEIFNMYLSGKGTKQIATILQGRGVPTKTNKVWRDAVVYGIIKNSLYCGKRRFKGEILEAPAIIDEETYNKASEIRVNNNQKLGINSKFEYLLNDRLIVCGVCHKSFFAHKRTNGNDSAYKCISIRYSENCGNTSISIDKLETAIKFVFLKDLLKLIKPKKEDTNGLKQEIEAYTTELKKIERQQNKLIDLYTSGLISKIKFADKTDEIKHNEVKINEMFIEAKKKLDNTNRAVMLNHKFVNAKDVLRIDIKKEFIKEVVKNIVITKDSKKLTDNSQDKTVKVDINSFAGNTITIYLSQRADYFLYNNKKVEFKDFK